MVHAIRLFYLLTRFLLVLPLLTAMPAYAESRPEELVLSVQAGRYALSPGLLAYEDQGAYYLPLLALSAAFEFRAEADLARNNVAGWALDEKQSFSFDLGSGEMRIRDVKESLPDNAVLSRPATGEDDFYIRMDVLNRIWPVTLSVDRNNLVLNAEVQGVLPFAQRQERKKRQSLWEKRRQKKTEDKKLTAQPNPYRLYGPPALDVETTQFYDESRGGFGGRVAVTGVQDLLWMSANYAAIIRHDSGQLESPESLRLRFDRDAALGQPLPFHLRHIELGDTRLRHAPLIKNSTGGRGFLLSSAKQKREGTFDVTTIEGTGPQGWDVELYRNNALVAFATVDERGEYRFEDVELSFGNNQIRIVLYGPQGQMREVVDYYSFGGNMLRPGQFQYTLGMLDAEKDLLPFQKQRRETLDGMAVNGELAYGFNRYITGYAAYSSLPTDQDKKSRDYVSLGTALSLPFGALQVEAYQEISPETGGRKRGRALDTRFITDVKGIKLNLRNALYDDFESPDAGYGASALVRQTEIGIQKNIPFAFGMLGLNLDYRNGERRGGHRFSNIGTRQSLSYNGLRLTHSTTSHLDGGGHRMTAGQLSATARIKKWRLRSSLNYDAFPEKKLRGFDGEIFYRANDKLSGSILARHDFQQEKSGAGLNLNYDFDRFIGSLETLWAEKTGAQITLRATTALGPYAKDGSYIMTSDRLTGASAVKARVFLDRNQDGVFDEGDEPLPSARVKINARHGKTRSAEDGLLVSRAGAGVEDAVIELDGASLEDPYHVAATEGFRTSLRPGSLPHFDFPVVETGAVDGTAYRPDGQVAQGVGLELVSAEGTVLQETETAYDGFYSFDRVPPGEYQLRTRADATMALPPRKVVVAADNLFAFGTDLAFADQAAPEQDFAQFSILPDNPPAIVQKVEITEQAESVKLVLDLSSPASYTAQRSENGRMIFVDLPQVGWQALRAWRGSPEAVWAGYDVEPLKEGGTRLKLSGKRRMTVEGGAFETAGTPSGRLAFDLVRD